MNNCPNCGKPVRANGSAWKCDYCKWPENKSYVQEERTPSLPSLSLNTSPVAVRPTAEAGRMYPRMYPRKKTPWKKREKSRLPKIEDCPEPLRSHCKRILQELIENYKREHGVRFVTDYVWKILDGKARYLGMTTKEERSQIARIRFARYCGNRSVLKKMQCGTFESHMARMRMAKAGWKELRDRDEAGKLAYLEWKQGKDVRNAWKVWQIPPKPPKGSFLT